MSVLNLIAIENKFPFEDSSDLFKRTTNTSCSEPSRLFDPSTELQIFDNSIRASLLDTNYLLDSSHHRQSQQRKMGRDFFIGDLSSHMNSDGVNKRDNPKGRYVPTFIEENADNSSDSFGASRSDSFEFDTMRRNGETLLNFVQNQTAPIPLPPSCGMSDCYYPNAVKEVAALDRFSELPCSNAARGDSAFEKPHEQAKSLSGNKRRQHEDSFLNFIQAMLCTNKTASRSTSGTCTLKEDASQSKEAGNENLLPEQQVRELTDNAILLVPLTKTNGPDDRRCAKRIKLDDLKGGDESNHKMLAGKIVDPLKRMCSSMNLSAQSMKALQEWDKKKGLPKSHCQTMVNSSRSREQLQSGLVLQKWNGVPLLLLPGAKIKVIRRKFRGVKIAELED